MQYIVPNAFKKTWLFDMNLYTTVFIYMYILHMYYVHSINIFMIVLQFLDKKLNFFRLLRSQTIEAAFGKHLWSIWRPFASATIAKWLDQSFTVAGTPERGIQGWVNVPPTQTAYC